MKKIIFILLLFSGTLTAQKLIYPDIPRDKINDMKFLSDSVGYFINNGGSIYRTADGGTTWKLQNHFQNNWLLKMRFLDDKIGFISSSVYNYMIPRKFYYTIDGGLNWSSNELDFINVLDFLPLSNQKILKCDDRGNIKILDNFYGDWKTVYEMPTFINATEEFLYEVPKGYIKKLEKLNDGRILAVGNYLEYFNSGKITDSLSFIFQSKDMGASWDTLWMGLNKLINCMAFADSNIGWIAGDNVIYKTTNGGKDWKPQSPDAKIAYVAMQIVAIDSLNVFIMPDYSGFYFQTNDGGLSWQMKEENFDYNNRFYFKDKKNGFAFGDGFYRTESSGDKWENISKSIYANISKIDFVSPSEGFAVSAETIYHTIDGGYSWSKIYKSYDNSSISDFEMLDELNGFLISGSRVFETSDGGITWNDSQDFRLTHFSMGGIDFYDNETGIIFNALEESEIGSNNYDLNYIFITEDGGKKWKMKRFDLTEPFYPFKMRFIDKETIICVSVNGVWKSYNKGDTWIRKYDQWLYGGKAYDFYNKKNGFISASASRYLYSTDGGESFTEMTKKSYVNARDLKFIGRYSSEAERVIEAGENGAAMIHYFYDTYENSYDITTYTGLQFNSISVFVENNRPHVWIAGDGFNVYYREYEMIVSAEKDLEIPNEYKLLQNYPNPFNPSTTIEYQLPKEGNVKLEVYNSLGQLVNVLVNTSQSTGNHKLVWNGKDSFGSSVASGIYFYRITSGNFSNVNKMILLK
ncbi:MAG: YCF48-related protein [Melioribacteraceae bacterium]